MGLPHATAFRFGQGHCKAVSNLYFHSRRDQKRARQIHTLERVATLFLGMTLGTPSAASKVHKKQRNHTRKDDTNIHVLNWGGPPLGVQILYTFPTPKTGIKQIEQFNDIILRILRSRLESQSWNSFNSFPIVNEVTAGVPTPPDSGKTPQLRTSKLAQNRGKTEFLHFKPSYGICWRREIETLPPM